MRNGLAIAVAALLLGATHSAQDGPKTTQPVPKDEKRHEGFVALAKKGGIELLFLGDSITDGWRGTGKKVWEKNFAPLKAANFGIGGDRTQHVLWRVKNGELEGIEPKLVVLLIGVNNTGDSAEDVVSGIKAILKEIQTKLSKTKILLLGIFPYKEKPCPAREKNEKVNEMLVKLDDKKSLKFLDIGDKFLDKDKVLSKEIMPDFLHPNEKGYEIWADAILATVKEMMSVK